ncbi:MAG: ROK family protein [Clostridia bacterium]|nr:ROK family protein [Clostridia bacterium]
MKLYGINTDIKIKPVLDPEFIPFYRWEKEYLKTATIPFAFSILRERGKRAVFKTKIREGEEFAEANRYYIERKIKFFLWAKGGYEITVYGNRDIYEYVRSCYEVGGKREFDRDFMSGVYDAPVTVKFLPESALPEERDEAVPISQNTAGCRIGFDAGGSDRKVSAVIDGETVYSEEVVWFPKTESDPDYHYNGILEAFRAAASKMPRVDAIGVSSAGIYIDNKTRNASLFIRVPKEKRYKVEDIYIRAAQEIGPVPLVVANDGDVTAFAGAVDLEDNAVLGIAMGTSEAGGYVDENGCLTGWLNELAFCPVDANPSAARDEWSGDIGCGACYFSQDAVIKLSPAAGITLDPALSPAEKLKAVQALAEEGHRGALDIFRSIGIYLGHSIPLYASVYTLRHVLLLGRVVSGKGGEEMLACCKKVLEEEYPDLKVNVTLPGEKFRRLGQSVAAAYLPKIG